MPETTKTVYRKTTTTTKLRVCRDDLLSAFNLPANAEITVRVPGGGDWSGETLEIGVDTELTAEWSETVEEGGE